mgnify:FL=1
MLAEQVRLLDPAGVSQVEVTRNPGAPTWRKALPKRPCVNHAADADSLARLLLFLSDYDAMIGNPSR